MTCEKHTPVAGKAANSMDQLRGVVAAYPPDHWFFVSVGDLAKLIGAADTLADVKQWLETGQVGGVGFDEEQVKDTVGLVLEDLK